MGGSTTPRSRTRTLPLSRLGARVDRAALGEALWALVTSRGLVWMAALSALALFGVNHALADGMDKPALTQPFGHTLNVLLAPSARYDAVWYLGIARDGYTTTWTTAFFPLLPLLLRAGGWLTGSPLIFGLLLSLGAAGVSLVLLHRLTAITVGEPAARAAVALQAFFPTALFLSAVYTESLFLALSLGSVLAARRGRWAWAGALGGLAAATRSTGILLLVPLAVMLLWGPREGGRQLAPDGTAAHDRLAGLSGRVAGLSGRVAGLSGRVAGLSGRLAGLSGRVAGLSGRLAGLRPRYALRAEALWLALVPAGLLAFLAYLQLAHGWGTEPFGAQAHWGRTFAGPFSAVWQAVRTLPEAIRRVADGTQQPLVVGTPFGWQAYWLIDFPYLFLALSGVWLCWRRLPFALFAYALVSVAEVLSYPTPLEPMESLSRFMLVIFPLFMAWGAVLAERPRLRIAVICASAVLLVGFSGLWGIWGWVA